MDREKIRGKGVNVKVKVKRQDTRSPAKYPVKVDARLVAEEQSF